MQELEGALSRVGSTPESSNGVSSILEGSTTPAHSRISTTHAPTAAGGREQKAVSGSSSSPATFVQTPAGSFSDLVGEGSVKSHDEACQWGPNWYFNGIAMSSEAGREWISQRTGQSVSWADFSIPIEKSSEACLLDNAFSPALCELPDKEVTREITKAYLKSYFRLVFPVLDDIFLKSTMETAYEPLEGTRYSTKQVSARACVLSLLAIAPRLDISKQTPLPVDADLCAAKARSLLLHIADDDSFTTLETALMLVSKPSL